MAAVGRVRETSSRHSVRETPKQLCDRQLYILTSLSVDRCLAGSAALAPLLLFPFAGLDEKQLPPPSARDRRAMARPATPASGR